MTTLLSTPALTPWTIPGPPPAPLLGRMGKLIEYNRDAITYLENLFDHYGDVAAFVAGGKIRLFSINPQCPGIVCIYRPEHIQQITTQHDVFHKNNLFGPLLPTGEVSERKQALKYPGAGLFDVNADMHRKHRRILMPAFHKKRIEAYRDDMVAITQHALDRWKIGEPRNIHNDMMHLTMRIATKTLFGQEMTESDTIGRMLRQMFKVSIGVFLFPHDLPGTPYNRYLTLIGQFNEAMRALIAQKRAKGTDDGDVLSMLLQARDDDNTRLTEDELLGHTSVIFEAGYETSSNALTWTLFLLSQHPQIAGQLLDELGGVLHGEPPVVEQLAQLPLLERVIKESLRLLPPAPVNMRISIEGCEMGGYQIPPNTEILADAYRTHRIPALYPEPYVFNPDRWLSIDPTPYEYHAFGAGPRMCIGAPFAMMEIKIILATLLQRYRLQMVPNATVDRYFGVTMSPKDGMPMIVNSQDGNYAKNESTVNGNVREMVTLPN